MNTTCKSVLLKKGGGGSKHLRAVHIAPSNRSVFEEVA